MNDQLKPLSEDHDVRTALRGAGPLASVPPRELMRADTDTRAGVEALTQSGAEVGVLVSSLAR